MKKAALFVLASVMALTLLTGCRNGNVSDGTNGTVNGTNNTQLYS